MNLTEKEKKVLELVNLYRRGGTWWYSDFYESIVELFGWDFNEVEKNARKIRYRLNKLVKKGYLEKIRVGHGYGGRSLFNSNHSTVWMIKRK